MGVTFLPVKVVVRKDNSPDICWESGSGLLESAGLRSVLAGSENPPLSQQEELERLTPYSDLTLAIFFFLISRRTMPCFPLVRVHNSGFCSSAEHSNR